MSGRGYTLAENDITSIILDFAHSIKDLRELVLFQMSEHDVLLHGILEACTGLRTLGCLDTLRSIAQTRHITAYCSCIFLLEMVCVVEYMRACGQQKYRDEEVIMWKGVNGSRSWEIMDIVGW